MRANELVVFDSIAGSNLPSQRKGAVLGFLEKHLGASPSQLARTHGSRALAHLHAPHTQQNMFRQHGEAALFGGLLAVVKHSVGLDVGTKTVVPVDLSAGLVGLGLGAFLAHKGMGLATECNNLAAASFTLYAFRKTDALFGGGLTRSKVTLGTKVSGEDDEDPILSCAKGL
jgi:hypothetical protein